jgi:hypothetical protein
MTEQREPPETRFPRSGEIGLAPWFVVFWIVMIPISYELGWLSSVAYVSALSLWALVSGHWSAWQAARVEVEQSRQVTGAQAHPVEDKVVDAMVEKTDIEQSRPK